jgi:hypothetical protein
MDRRSQKEQVGTLPGVENVSVVMPVVDDPVRVALVILELSREIAVYCVGNVPDVPVLIELMSKLTYASAVLLGAAAL